VKINILDTPGHADFGGEVERVLTMVEGAMLLVDASEGPLPQTRFVLQKAMEARLAIVVCINKIDRPDARAEEVLNEVYDLFIDLDADENQLDFPVLWACARDGLAHYELGDDSTDLTPLLDTVLKHVPAPRIDGDNQHGRVLVTNLDYDPYVGRLAIGRLFDGPLRRQQPATLFTESRKKPVRLPFLYTWDGLKRQEVEEASPGDIIALAGIEDVTVGDTVASGPDPKAMDRITVDEPTIGMTFSINTSPFSGRDGKFLTSRQIRERLERELLSNVSLRLDEVENGDAVKVFGRGELQLAILIEQMRREGFELTVSRPEVLSKQDGGKSLEPWEIVTVDIPDDFVGILTQKLTHRKGQLQDMVQDGSGRTRLVYRLPSRGLMGFRGEFLTDTRGEGVMNAIFDGWDVDAGPIVK
jgi:GTP-binding protein